MATTRMTQAGDIVQITDENHPWFPCLAVVKTTRSHDVKAYVTIPVNGDVPNGNASVQLRYDQCQVVGRAAIVAVPSGWARTEDPRTLAGKTRGTS
jgi:hypothetical protein